MNVHVAVERMRNASLEVVGARRARTTRTLAMCELYGPREYDQISVSTLDRPRSRWLSAKGACRTWHR